MAFFLAVANRKGGVGKSTVSVMLAYAYALWSNKRVLLIDLDAQSNSSLILLGGERWIESQRTSKHIAAYMEDRLYSIEQTRITDYLTEDVGDVEDGGGELPALRLLAGSLAFEELQDELITHFSKTQGKYGPAKRASAHHFKTALNTARHHADLVILDCAPGLSNATAAALDLADKVIVPFRPDAVSLYAIDQISKVIERARTRELVEAIPKEDRRYICLANYVRDVGRDRAYIDEIANDHPMLASEIPAMPAVADAFDFLGEPQSIEEKYGAAVAPLQKLHGELSELLAI